MAGLCVLHISQLRRAFAQSIMKILPRVKEIWRVHEIPWNSTVTESWVCTVWSSVHRLPEVNIWTSLNALPCKGNRNMEGVQNSKFLNSWPSIVTLTFREHGWSDGVCTSPYWRYDQSLMKILPRWQRYGMEQNSRLKLVTFSCDFDLESAWLSYRFCIAFYCREHFT